jgi:signal recognition particle subunit SRP72
MTSLTSLLKNTSLDDHESILEAVTGRDTSDIEAQHVKVVALLKLDRFQDALKVFEGTDDTLKTQAQLEWAYTLYKNGRLAEAEEVAARDNKRRSLKHVLAQTSYRAEKFAQVGDLYDILRKQRSGDESSDLKINSGATDAQLGWSGQGHLARKTKPDREDMEQFETAFNAACGYISRGELKQAELLLSRARGVPGRTLNS